MVDKGIHTFLKDISLKLKAIRQLEFEIIYYVVTVQHISHYTMGITPATPGQSGLGSKGNKGVVQTLQISRIGAWIWQHPRKAHYNSKKNIS